ncbi:YciI family protein [Cryptosporangium phraense]|uniref:YciI family protein n=1 Tax=Cryptosporangium phraense TaxID=2593070 RepID=A0A545AVI7_9ACTN|nr:YciI family protein [Cryptosporangium phraense]TQS45347.1 YciI family protein [Cryptosporangium phraense]
MRFLVIMKATAESEAGVLPATEDFDTMGSFIEELVDDGVLLSTEGLTPSAGGARIYFDGGKTSVVDGPFTEAKELIAGFWLVEMKSLEEVVERFKRCPIQRPANGEQTNLEIRRVWVPEDFGENFTAEQQETVEQRRARAGGIVGGRGH